MTDGLEWNTENVFPGLVDSNYINKDLLCFAAWLSASFWYDMRLLTSGYECVVELFFYCDLGVFHGAPLLPTHLLILHPGLLMLLLRWRRERYRKAGFNPTRVQKCMPLLSLLLQQLWWTCCDHLEVNLWASSRTELLFCGWSIWLVSHYKTVTSWWACYNDRCPQPVNWKWHLVLQMIDCKKSLKTHLIKQTF